MQYRVISKKEALNKSQIKYFKSSLFCRLYSIRSCPRILQRPRIEPTAKCVHLSHSAILKINPSNWPRLGRTWPIILQLQSLKIHPTMNCIQLKIVDRRIVCSLKFVDRRLIWWNVPSVIDLECLKTPQSQLVLRGLPPRNSEQLPPTTESIVRSRKTSARAIPNLDNPSLYIFVLKYTYTAAAELTF